MRAAGTLRRAAAVLALAGTLGVARAETEAPVLSMAEIQQAFGLLKQGEPLKARRLLEFVRIGDNVPVRLQALRMTLLAQAEARLERPRDALGRVQEARALMMKAPPAEVSRDMLGGMYLQESQFRRNAGVKENLPFLREWKKFDDGKQVVFIIRAAADLGEYKTALDFLNAAIKKAPQDLVLRQMRMDVLRESGKLPLAVEESKTIRKLAKTPADKTSLAISLALLWVDLGFSDKAAGELAPVDGKGLDPQLQGQLLHTKALVMVQEGRTQKALEMFKDALALLAGGLPEIRANMQAEQARTNLVMGRLGEAYAGYTYALAMNPPLLARLRMLTARGIVLERQGFTRSAMGEHTDAVTLAARAGLPVQVAVGLNNMATAAREGGMFQESLRYQWGAAMVDAATGDTQGLATDYENMGRVYTKLGQPGLARWYIGKARRTHQQADVLLKLRLGRSMGEACRLARDFACARTEFAETARLARTSGVLDILWMAQAGLARTLRDTGDKAGSVALFEQAVTTIETMRDVAGASPDERAAFLLERRPVYGDLLRVYLALGRSEEAFATLERMRARTLLDRLRESGSRLDEELSAKERLQETALEIEVKTRLAILNEKRDKQALSRFERARADLETFRKTLDKKYPKLAFFRGRGGKPSPDVVRKLLPDGGLMLLIHLDEEGAAVFALSKDGFKVFESPRLKPAALKMLVQDRLRGSIAGGVWGTVQERAAKLLYQELVAPAVAAYPGMDTVLISPEEVLAELPLGVLMNSEGKFLGDSAGVLTIPSATTWTYARSLRGRPEPGSKWVVLADPVFADEKLAPLKGTEAEAARMKTLFPKTVEVFTQGQATEDKVSGTGAKAGLLHLATHGLLNPRSPMQSKVALAAAPDKGGDGFLEVWEILKLNLGASLVVLSACDSARGEALAGEGLQGLAQAFLRAGSPRVMATLWEVNDESTSYLVQQFYEQLKTKDIAQAMRSAQAMTREKFSANPFYWAPFVLLGPGWEGDLAGLGEGP